MPSGGARKGSGRKPAPDQSKVNWNHRGAGKRVTPANITPGLVLSYATFPSLSSRYSSSGVFGQWGFSGNIYCFVGFPSGGRSVSFDRGRVVPQVTDNADGLSVDLVALNKSVSALSALSSRVASVEKLLESRI